MQTGLFVLGLAQVLVAWKFCIFSSSPTGRDLLPPYKRQQDIHTFISTCHRLVNYFCCCREDKGTLTSEGGNSASQLLLFYYLLPDTPFCPYRQNIGAFPASQTQTLHAPISSSGDILVSPGSELQAFSVEQV